ncbi:NUDIX domain-containing protein [Guptibacillus algicola]|uniref:NUDIX domain-containing protein n=1 Tax=Guptibacillus algicola TaxID=225844 RepID=UPI001CD4B4FD|nr:NUDIX domain-containing protein [Alkalihalobacillus algicola]MCA0988539.1 NUDIX domain-containing protein [Alkalihalobacillus algicola]
MFNKTFGIEKPDGATMNDREAVRAVIIRGNRILLVHSNLGDYKFPGGGVEESETHVDALLREIAEETGYVNGVIGEKVGIVVERSIDIYDEGAIFEMNSHYYFCEVTDETASQQLDDYELEQEFTPKWVTLGEAIDQNHVALERNSRNSWIHRENAVLVELKRMNNITS